VSNFNAFDAKTVIEGKSLDECNMNAYNRIQDVVELLRKE